MFPHVLESVEELRAFFSLLRGIDQVVASPHVGDGYVTNIAFLAGLTMFGLSLPIPTSSGPSSFRSFIILLYDVKTFFNFTRIVQ